MQSMVGKQAIFFQEQIWDIGGGMGFLIPAHTPSCYDSDESDSPPPSMPAPLPKLSTEGGPLKLETRSQRPAGSLRQTLSSKFRWPHVSSHRFKDR